MNNIREDVHRLVAANMDRTERRVSEPILCDYLADLARLFVNLMEEESRYQFSVTRATPQEQEEQWRVWTQART